MKVLIADTFEWPGVEKLSAAGCEVVYRPDLSEAALAQSIRELAVDVLIVRGTRVTAEMLDASNLSLVVRAGAGYNTIDVHAASSRGIYVSNCPGKNAIAVAELAFALMLALDRRLPDNVRDLRAGVWNKLEYSQAAGLSGRTLGLLGYGYIGQEMATRARAFGMPVVVWSRRFAEGGQVDATGTIQIARTPQEVAERCDVLSVHLALVPETRKLVDASILGRLKPGSIFINTARAEIVDCEALAAAVRERQLKVGLDVFANEPSGAGPFSDPLMALPTVYGTHHIGASTAQAQQAIAEEAVRVVVEYKTTGHVRNVVNLAKRTPATHTLVVRHRDRPGVLAHVFDQLRAENINVQETENVIFDGAQAAVARINLDAAPSESLLGMIKNGDSRIIDLQLIRIEGHDHHSPHS